MVEESKKKSFVKSLVALGTRLSAAGVVGVILEKQKPEDLKGSDELVWHVGVFCLAGYLSDRAAEWAMEFYDELLGKAQKPEPEKATEKEK